MSRGWRGWHMASWLRSHVLVMVHVFLKVLRVAVSLLSFVIRVVPGLCWVTFRTHISCLILKVPPQTSSMTMSAFGQVPEVAARLQVEAHCGFARQSSFFGRIGQDCERGSGCTACFVVVPGLLHNFPETLRTYVQTRKRTQTQNLCTWSRSTEVEAVAGSKQLRVQSPRIGVFVII